MRKIAFTCVMAALVFAVSPVSADDFSALTSGFDYGQPVQGQVAQVQHTLAGGCASGSCAAGPQLIAGGGFAAGVCNGCSDGSCGNAGCKEGVCVPHRTPDIPGSSLRQYWRSSACNTGVWDGYRKSCSEASKHTRGECDCFSGKKKKLLGCAGNCGGGCGDPACAPAVAPIVEVPAVAIQPVAPCDSPGGCDATSAWSSF